MLDLIVPLQGVRQKVSKCQPKEMQAAAHHKKVQSMTINDKPLEVTNHEKDLGVYVNSDLT